MVDARAYHEATNHSPDGLRESTYEMDERIRPRPFKSYVDRPVEPLTAINPPQLPALAAIAESSADPTTTAAPTAVVDRGVLGTIGYLAAGITQETSYKGERVRFRAASCTGNLHHIDLYLVTGAVDGLDAGTYHFDPTTFALARLRSGDHRRHLVEACGAVHEDASAWIVATSTWWRNAWKYQARAYRHAFWDSGTVIANLLAAAHGLDVPAQVVTGFADHHVADLLGIDTGDELPLAAIPLGTGAAPADATSLEPVTFATRPLSDDRVEFPAIVDAWAQSTLANGAAASAWRADCQSATGQFERPPAAGDRIALDPVDDETASSRPLLDTIRRRGSKRQFADVGPSRRQLGTVLDRATRGVPGDWNGGEADGFDVLDCYVLTTGVEGVDDGTYQFHPSEGALERLGPTESADQQRLALDQPWAGEAHVSVYLMADIDAIVSALGNRGYRLAQLEAGITLGRLYLATSAHRDLGGTGLTFFDDAVTEYLAPRAEGQWPMTLFSFGRVDREAGPRL